jgi:hypothetical protein
MRTQRSDSGWTRTRRGTTWRSGRRGGATRRLDDDEERQQRGGADREGA